MPLLIRLLILLMAETDFNHVWSALRYPGYVPFPVIDMTWKIPTIFSAVAGIESIFVAFLLWRPKNVFALVGAGLSTFILVNLDLDYRYQFDFLPAVFYFAWATSVMLRKSERHRNWLDLPLVLLMTTLYTFASFHKLVHFGSMQIQMGNRLVEYLPALKPVCESAGCGVHQFLFWTVIPVEAALAYLTAFRKHLRPRLILACAFHSTLSIIPFIFWVSTSLLGIHLLIACQQDPEMAKEALKRRKWWKLAVIETLFIASSWADFPSIGGPLLHRIAVGGSFSAVPVFFLWPFFARKRLTQLPPRNPDLSRSLLRPRHRAEYWVVLYLLSLLLFGFSPLILDPAYSIPYGWGMFATVDPWKYRLQTPPKTCFTVPASNDFLKVSEDANHYYYIAHRAAPIRYLAKLFIRQNCFSSPDNLAWHFEPLEPGELDETHTLILSSKSENR